MGRFLENDVVVYGKSGICRITEIKKMSFDKSDLREYYVLAPINNPRSTCFVPVDSDLLCSRIRNIMTKEEIDSTLSSARDLNIDWIEDKKERNRVYRDILSSSNPGQMFLLAQCLYMKKVEKESAGRKLWSTDEALLTSLEKIISQEISRAVGIPETNVVEYIRNRLDSI